MKNSCPKRELAGSHKTLISNPNVVAAIVSARINSLLTHRNWDHGEVIMKAETMFMKIVWV